MRRIGVASFLLLTFTATVVSNGVMVHEYGALELKFWLVTGWFPFRMFEFTSGMAIGWLLIAPEARGWRDVVRHPATILALLIGGFALHTAGDLLIGRWTIDELVRGDNHLYLQAIALPLVTLGLAAMAVPLVVRAPSRVDVWGPVRAFAAIGVMSYAILIINDPMRLIASQLRVEDVNAAVWWTFLVAVYVPVSLLIGWPLAQVLGLMPRRHVVREDVVERPPRPALNASLEVPEVVGTGG